ncbi:MAG: SBBP repeat-containing protein [Armatimonadia bacterium]
MRTCPRLSVLGITTLLAAMLLVSCLAPGGCDASRFRLVYCTYLGGPAWEQAREIIPYPDGSVLIGAQVNSDGLPVSEGAAQPHYAGDDPNLGPGGVYGGDCYLAHLSADGSEVLAGTYFGGSRQERNTYGMGLDRQGNIVITTTTRSTDIHTTPGCFQPKYAGGENEIVVAKITPDCKKVLWCTYLGGSAGESPRGGLGIDAEDNVYIVGTTNSANYPTTPGVVGGKLKGPRDSLISKLSPDGSQLLMSTLLGGTGEDDAIMGIRLDKAGNLYVAGHTRSADFPVTPGAPQPKLGGQSDCYLAKLSPAGDRILYATYLGGSGNEFAEHRPWLSEDGTFLLAGSWGSADFTGTVPGRRLAGRTDGFLTKLSSDGTRFVFSLLLGGAGTDNLLMPTPDRDGNIWVVGSTASRDLPVTADAFQKSFGGGQEDAVLAAFSAEGTRLVYCSYLGGTGDEMIRSLAFGPDGALYLVGNTTSPNFPATPGALQTRFGGGPSDAFVMKLVPTGTE